MKTESGTNRAIVTVHGTWAGKRDPETPRWWEKNSAFCANLTKELGEDADFHEYIWSGENSFLFRETATKEFVNFLEPLSKTYDRIDVIAHSHGGNVVANALFDNRKNSRGVMSKIQNVVSVGTPFFGRRTPFLRRFAKLFIIIGQLYALLFAGIAVFFGFGLVANDTGYFEFFALVGYVGIALGLLVLYILYRMNRQGSRFRILFGGKSNNPAIRWHVICHPDDEAVNSLRIAESTHYSLIKKDTVKRMMSTLFNNIFMLVLGGMLIYEVFLLVTRYSTTSSGNLQDQVILELPAKLLLIPFAVYLAGHAIIWVIGKLFSGPLSSFANRRISGGIRAVCFGQDGPTILRDVQE